MVIDNKKQKFLIIESKDFSAVRTPYELNLEMGKIFGDNGHLKKHERRVNWFKNNLENIIKYFGLNEYLDWCVKSIFVSNEPLFSSHFHKQKDTEMISVTELKEIYHKRCVS